MGISNIFIKLVVILSIESAVLTFLSIIANVIYFKAGEDLVVTGLLVFPVLYFMYKFILEMVPLMIIFRPSVVSKGISLRKFLCCRGVVSIATTIILVLLALEVGSRDLNIFHVLPILYIASIILSYPLYKRSMAGSLCVW